MLQNSSCHFVHTVSNQEHYNHVDGNVASQIDFPQSVSKRFFSGDIYQGQPLNNQRKTAAKILTSFPVAVLRHPFQSLNLSLVTIVTAAFNAKYLSIYPINAA